LPLKGEESKSLYPYEASSYTLIEEKKGKFTRRGNIAAKK